MALKTFTFTVTGAEKRGTVVVVGANKADAAMTAESALLAKNKERKEKGKPPLRLCLDAGVRVSSSSIGVVFLHEGDT